MKEEIIQILKEITEYDKLEQNTNIDLLENDIIDSLSFIELITALEDKFDIEIQPTQVPSHTWRSIDSIVELVEKLIEE